MSIRILVVDDEALHASLFQQRFRRRIQSGDYQFHFATSGREALTFLSGGVDFDVFLFDINMPDMDGLTLLELASGLQPDARTVMVSAYGDMPNIRIAMNRGALDFITKPIDFQDLEQTINKTAAVVEALRESARIKALAEWKARFFDNLTHEFRTPLSLILAPAQALLRETDGHTRDQLEGIIRNAGQLRTLIDQLLDLARLEEGRLPVEESVQDLVGFLSAQVELFRPVAPGLVFRANQPVCEALFDSDKWGKIVSNLLANAVKFTPSGGLIEMWCQVTDIEVLLCVQDSGPGIPPEQLPFIFDRFHQVPSGETGSGIGLALVHELTRLLNGRASVTNTPKGGAAFSVILPLQTIDPDQAAILSGNYLPLPETETTGDKPLLLLVDNNPELLRYLFDLLKDTYQILTAPDGQSALELARRELPDVVISDVRMPGMDGFRLTRLLRTHPATDHIPVLLLTALSSVDHLLEGLSEGADDYLLKPFRPEELTLRLRNLLRRREKWRAYYHSKLENNAALPAGKSPDTFLHRLTELIDRHLDDPGFRTESLADEVAMSPRNLTRKLGMLADISPARLIRTHRLRRAADLLKTGATVADTAYAVGFENPSYFATAFREYFGRTPTEYARE